MKNKLLKRTMCAAMALCVSVAAISCGNKSNNGGSGDNPGGTKKTEISFLHFDGTATRNGAIKWQPAGFL